MGKLRPLIDWSVLALCIAAAAGAVIFGVVVGMQPRHASSVLPVIIALTVVNCGFLIAAAVSMARGGLRLVLR